MLVPYPLVSILLTAAEGELFEPRWSDQILDEVERTLTGKLGLDPSRAGHRLAQMRAGFPESSVHGYEDLVPEMTCDPKDRHVLAAAVAVGADLLVTRQHLASMGPRPGHDLRQGPRTPPAPAPPPTHTNRADPARPTWPEPGNDDAPAT